MKTPNDTDSTTGQIQGNSQDIELFIGEQLFVEEGEGENIDKKDIGVFRNYGTNSFTGYGDSTTLENYGSSTISNPNGKDIYIPQETFSLTIIGRSQNYKSRCSQLQKDIYVYSFAINPEEHQPSGTCNFSKLDSAKLIFSESSKVSNIYAVNYNVLRIVWYGGFGICELNFIIIYYYLIIWVED